MPSASPKHVKKQQLQKDIIKSVFYMSCVIQRKTESREQRVKNLPFISHVGLGGAFMLQIIKLGSDGLSVRVWTFAREGMTFTCP